MFGPNDEYDEGRPLEPWDEQAYAVDDHDAIRNMLNDAFISGFFSLDLLVKLRLMECGSGE